MYPSWSTGSVEASSSISPAEYASGFSQNTASPCAAARAASAACDPLVRIATASSPPAANSSSARANRRSSATPYCAPIPSRVPARQVAEGGDPEALGMLQKQGEVNRLGDRPQPDEADPNR